MQLSQALPTRRLTANEVFAVLMSDVRQTWANADEKSGPTLSPDSPLTDLVDAYSSFDGPDPLSFVFCCEYAFGIRIRHAEARHLFDLRQALTIAEFCEFLASKAEAVRIEPVTVLGRPCLAAGAFLAVRRLLDRAGADMTDLAPSSALLPYLRRWPRVFRWDVAKMAPGRLPILRYIMHPVVQGCVSHFGNCLLLAGLFFLLHWIWQFGALLAIHELVLGILFLLTGWLLSATRFPPRVELGELQDFRDLCYVLAAANALSSARPADDPC